MSDTTTAAVPATAPATEPNDEIVVDVEAVTSRLDKHMQRLPWAATRMDGGPMSIQNFLRDWIVPILSDMHQLTSAAISMQQDTDEMLESVAAYAQRTLVTAQSTLQGESIALLHMHFQRIHSTLVNKLDPNDPTSFALAEMHELFVKLGLEEPYFTEEEKPADASSGMVETPKA